MGKCRHGLQLSQTDAKSQTTTLTYDVLGRPSTRSESGLYSAWTYGTSLTNHNVGKVIEAQSCTASGCSSVVTDKHFTYDTLSRPSQMVLFTGSNFYGYADSYNPLNGQLARTAYPSSFVLNRIYNQYGYLCRLTDYHNDSPTCSAAGSGTQVFLTVNSRDAELHLTQSTAGNGVVTTQTFDPNTGLIETQRAGSSGAVASFDYGFDTIGNLTSRADNDEFFTERFCYDSLNRLTNDNFGAACTGGKTVSYNAIGNITAKSDTGTYSYPTSGSSSTRPHAVSSISGTVDGLTNPQYSYDNNGNLTCTSTGSGCSGTVGRQLTVTSFNMAASVVQGSTTVDFTYDEQHQRVAQASTVSSVTTTTTYLNDSASGAMALKTVTGSSVTPIWTDYIMLDGQIVGQRISAYAAASAWGAAVWNSFHWGGIIAATQWNSFSWGAAPWGGTVPVTQWGSFNWGAAPWTGPPSISWFVLDHLGSVAVITNLNGTVVQRLSYDAWGKQRNANGSDVACGTIQSTSTRGFTNQEEVPAECLVNLNARLYDPSIGRFMSADPS